jgi:ATP-dependent exoDNAse (exonuclease V) beta subunit
MQSFIQFLGSAKIKGRWKQYKSPEYYNFIWKNLEIHLRNMCNQTQSLEIAVELFNAEKSVQIMNVHKCKGLEYNSVYFLGFRNNCS